MRKLCIAVILFSFLGFGPLKSIFHNDIKTDGSQAGENSFFEKVKEKVPLSSGKDKVKTFLVTEKMSSADSDEKQIGLILRRDSANNRLSFSSIPLTSSSEDMSPAQLKNSVKENYQISIDYCFVIDSSGVAKMLNLLIPNGITIEPKNNGTEKLNQQVLRGEEIVSYINQLPNSSTNEEELITIFSAIKKEMTGSLSTEKLLSLAPAIVNEARNSVKTDLPKGEFVELGISTIMNPITKLEQLQLSNTNKTQPVNSDIQDEKQMPLLN